MANYPEWTQFHYELITNLADNGYGRQINDALQKFTVKESGNATVWYILGMLYQALDEQNKAVVAYRKGLERDPTNAVLYFNLGNALKNNEKASIA